MPSGRDPKKFAGEKYKFSRHIGDTQGSGLALATERSTRLSLGISPEVYITCIYRWKENPVVTYISEKANAFGMRLGGNKFIMPLDGSEEQFWIDARKILHAVENRDNVRIDLQDTCLYFLLSTYHPQLLSDTDAPVPFLLIELGLVTPVEATALLSKLLDLFHFDVELHFRELVKGEQKKEQKKFGNDSKSYGQRLLEGEGPGQDENHPIRRALRIIANICLVIDRISIRFYGFPWSVETEFDSIYNSLKSDKSTLSKIAKIKEDLRTISNNKENDPLLDRTIKYLPKTPTSIDKVQLIPASRNLRDVFLCHRSLDKEYVRNLTDQLKGKGFSVWFDEAEIKWGESIISRISEGVKMSRFVIVCVGKSFKNGNYAKYELDLAMSDELKYGINKVLPLLLTTTSEEEQHIIDQVPSLRSKSYLTLKDGTNSVLDELAKLIDES